MRPWQTSGGERPAVLLLGSGPRARRVAERLGSRYRVCAFLDDDPAPRDLEVLGERYRGRLEGVADLCSEEAVATVVYGLPRRFLGDASVAHTIALCETLGIDVTIPLDLFDTRANRALAVKLGDIAALSLTLSSRHVRWQLAAKRSLDVVGAALALALSLPVWVLAAIAIKLDSTGPVFFVQERCGLRGRLFPLFKFRTMTVDADERKEELEKHNEVTGPVFKISRDPRITRVGRLLRKSSIDELPQLWNVLCGHMSLVGPRPPVPKEVAQYEVDHRARLNMRPGITGLWQVSGRSEIGFEEWVKLDLEYIRTWSLRTDLEILLATVPAVLSARGAE